MENEKLISIDEIDRLIDSKIDKLSTRDLLKALFKDKLLEKDQDVQNKRKMLQRCQLTLHEAVSKIYLKKKANLSKFTKMRVLYDICGITNENQPNTKSFSLKRDEHHSFDSFMRDILNKQFITEITTEDLNYYLNLLDDIAIGPQTKEQIKDQLILFWSDVKECIFLNDLPNPCSEIENFSYFVDKETGETRYTTDFERETEFDIQDFQEFLIAAWDHYVQKKHKSQKDQIIPGIHMGSLNILLTIALTFGIGKRRNEIRLLRWSNIYDKKSLIKKFKLPASKLTDFRESDRFLVHRKKPTENRLRPKIIASWLHPILISLLEELRYYYEQRVEENFNSKKITEINEFPAFIFPSSHKKFKKPITHYSFYARFLKVLKHYENLDLKRIKPHSIRYEIVNDGPKHFALKIHEQELILGHKLIKISNSSVESDDGVESSTYRPTKTRDFYDKSIMIDELFATRKWAQNFFGKPKLAPMIAYFNNKENLSATFYYSSKHYNDLREKNLRFSIRNIIMDELMEKFGEFVPVKQVNLVNQVLNRLNLMKKIRSENSIDITLKLLSYDRIISIENWRNGKKVSKYARNAEKIIKLQPKSLWKIKPVKPILDVKSKEEQAEQNRKYREEYKKRKEKLLEDPKNKHFRNLSKRMLGAF